MWTGVALLGLVTAASAHPFGDRYAAQRLDVIVDPEGVTVWWQGDIPRALLPQRDGATDMELALARAAAALSVTVDGASVPLRELSRRHSVDLVSMHTELLTLALRADVGWLPGVPFALEVGNANLVGEPCWYFDTLTVPATAEVRSTDLAVRRRDGGLDVLAGRWTRAEPRRRVRATLTIPADPLSRWLTARGAPGVPVAQRLPASAWTRWRTGQHDRGTAAAAAALCALGGLGLGTVLRARRPGWSGGAGILAAAVGCALAVATVPPALAGLLTVSLLTTLLGASLGPRAPAVGLLLALVAACGAAARALGGG